MSDGRVEYARSGDIHLAYQSIGDAGRDVVLLVGGTMPMDALDQHPRGLRVIHGLGRLGRLILTDPRGIGQSDSPDRELTPDIEADDLESVLEACDAEDCILVAGFDAAISAIELAARRPSRLAALAIVNGYSSFQRGKTQVEELTAERFKLFHQVLDGARVDGDMVAVAAPSERNNERWRAWFEEAGRRGASPRAAGRRWSAHEVVDVSQRLSEVAVPTVVVHREDNLIVSAAHARFMADQIPGARLVLLPGSDNLMYAGDVDGIVDAIIEFAGASVARAPTNRVLTTVLFTDIVSSTYHAVALGDRRWTALLDVHDSLAQRVIGRHGGVLVKSTGDGLLVTFDSPGDALRCAAGLRDELADLGIEIRSGIHVGEAQRRGSDVSGVAVHLAARVMALAEPGEVLVSSAVPPVMVGSEIEFEDRGTHELRGVPGSWPLYAARL